MGWRSVASHCRLAASRMRAPAARLWPVVQQTAAATLAWLLAVHLAQHREPFFAPIAALVALNTPLGGRGFNAVRLLLGVLVGIATAEIAMRVMGGGYGTLAVAVFVAIALARAIDSTRIVIAQAGSGAILTVVTADGHAGPQRLVDALLGAAVALVFSQLLFPPDPLRLLRAAEADALNEMARGLKLAAQALESGDEEPAGRALGTLRHMHDQLAEVDRLRQASGRVVRHSITWRWRRASVAQENINAGHLDLLANSCLMLARAVTATPVAQLAVPVARTRVLAGLLHDLAAAPGAVAVRRRAATRAGEIAAEVIEDMPPAALAGPALGAWTVAADIMAFAGAAHAERAHRNR